MSEVFGVAIGIVTKVEKGRVKLHFPWLDENYESDWARVAAPMAGSARGAFLMPEVNDEVLVAFDHGDTRFPYVVGFLWNGKDLPPGEDVRDRKLVSKNGHQIRFLDSTDGSKGALIIEDANGNRITMSEGKIKIESKLYLEIEAAGIFLQGPNGSYRRRILSNSNPI